MAQTYDAIASYTFGSAASSYTFSSIAASWTDLILVSSVKWNTGGSAGTLTLQFNGDTSTNYSWTYLQGNGTAASSGRGTNSTVIAAGQGASSSGSAFGTGICHIFNYANTTTYKTTLARCDVADNATQVWVSLWRKTPEAITSILVNGPYQFAAGSTLSLYGVKSA
jgi:hypothetical protein